MNPNSTQVDLQVTTLVSDPAEISTMPLYRDILDKY
jgi:hypothetical protein